ncbi:putative disease resistance protein [Cinnamomum micranthum f. kanehirae]|uniref:Putative disease resistance protein n=1 Tax=Cinnamomum micranthum f. kanehirae TaxID=337451 RepID=A0A3S3MNP0_9MAGN|nr:putative disease resistance protein [Cinnamomum micranthum f. kanehirae]
MENIGSLLDIGNLASSLIGPEIDYITNPEKKMEELNNNARYLFAWRDDVEETIRESPNVATRESKLWLEDVKRAEHLVESTKVEHMQCSNVFSRLTLGKRVERVIEEIIDLNYKRPKLKGKEFLNAPPLERVEPQIVEINSSTDSEPRLQKILGLIEDVSIRKIGIWGMGGIGKTRTLKLLNNRLKESHMFDIVIWVTVSGEGSPRKVQNDIAERLKCTVIDMSDDRLKANICHHLRGKKFLLILDDIWERIDLSDVGIPIPNQDNGCKVLLTTRDFGVCQQMETDVEIKMEKLSEEEARSLFNEKVGDVATSPCIEPIARDIIKKCGGLPLAIVVVGSSLRRKSDVAVWRNTLRELQLPCTSQIKGMEKEVFSCLRISYDRLPNDCERNLFLYCSLYPEDWKILITELAERCWLEGYIRGVDSIEDARDKGRHMVINLVDASLLERGDDEEYVKMHDIIRDFALKEASGFLVKTGKHVRLPPMENEWVQLKKLSMIECSLCGLLERPNCRDLSTLLLQGNRELTMIPDSFFELMQSLTILDLSGTNIESFPSSLFNLVYLRGLYLRGCYRLKDLPAQVRQLRQLEVLHLGNRTEIDYLPIEVGELTSLKRLIVGFSLAHHPNDSKERNMRLRVPIGMIPKLPLLEELGMHTSGYAAADQWDDESMEVIVDELCRLERLTYLDFYFPKEECLAHFLNGSKSWKARWFRRFRFRVGCGKHWGWDSVSCHKHEAWEGRLVYRNGDEISHVAIMETLAHCSYFHLEDHYATQKLSEFGMANMNELKICRIKDCHKMEMLFDGDGEQQTCAMLPNLETLVIANLSNLRRLWVGRLLPGSLSKLTHLELCNCNSHRLKKVFLVGMIQQLPSLETLKIDWWDVDEIIGIEEETSVPCHAHISNNDRVILPNIKRIVLRYLPGLFSFCRGVSLEWPSLESIDIYECPNLKSLSFLTHGTDIVAPALKKIGGPTPWWEALEWEDDDIKRQLQPLFRKH